MKKVLLSIAAVAALTGSALAEGGAARDTAIVKQVPVSVERIAASETVEVASANNSDTSTYQGFAGPR